VTVSTGSGSGTIRLDLIDDDSISDAVGNLLGGSGAGNGDFTTGEVYTMDRTSPSVSSINRASGNPTSASSVDFTVTFDESVTGVDATDFTFATTGAISGVSVTSVSADTGLTRTVTVDTGSGSGTIRLDLADDDSIMDGVGNVLGGAGLGNGDHTSGQVYTIDKSGPLVSSIVRADANPTNASSVDFTVTFSASVTGVTTDDFTLSTSGISGASVTSVGADTGATRTVSVTTGSGTGTIRLDVTDDDSIVDALANKLGGTGVGNGDYSAGEVYTMDRTSPSVSSSLRADANPTNASSVDFTVTFDESVTGVDTTDFSPTTTGGVSGASVTGVSADTGATRTVTVNTGSGSGTIRLVVVDDDSVVDGVGNVLGGSGAGNGDYGAGQAYAIDKTPPVVSSIVRADTDPTNALSVDFTVTFSKVATGVDTSDFTLTTTGTIAGALVTAVSADTGTTRTVTVDTGTGDGTLRLDVVDDDSIIDAVTNPLGGTGAGNGDFTTGEAYTIDKSVLALLPVVGSLGLALLAAACALAGARTFRGRK
jgi:hypothetical protein